VQGGHAFRVLEAYESWFASSGISGQRQLAVLRLLGFFDRPAAASCLTALRNSPSIAGLTESICDIPETEWNMVLKYLEKCALVSFQVKPFELQYAGLDTHPIIREYFSSRLVDSSLAAWREGHRRLFKYLCSTTPAFPEGIMGLQPLYQAVGHGCKAGEYEQALGVLANRIERLGSHYSTTSLGAFSANLKALSFFYERAWASPYPSIDIKYRGWLLNFTAYYLRGLNRLLEAVEPFQMSRDVHISQKRFDEASRAANNLSELQLILGNIFEAIRDANEAVKLAGLKSEVTFRAESLASLADAYHQCGQVEDALKSFREAEGMYLSSRPKCPVLCLSLGFKYCDLLLAEAERLAWRIQNGSAQSVMSVGDLGEQRESRTPDIEFTIRLFFGVFFVI
jgi:tetratricopeptide (TPR) repeat protein